MDQKDQKHQITLELTDEQYDILKTALRGGIDHFKRIGAPENYEMGLYDLYNEILAQGKKK